MLGEYPSARMRDGPHFCVCKDCIFRGGERKGRMGYRLPEAGTKKLEGMGIFCLGPVAGKAVAGKVGG